MTGAVTANYHVDFDGLPTSTAPDLMGVFREGQLGASTVRPVTIGTEDVARLIEWLESDSLDWDAVARIRENGW
jgi:hypothetical protein